MIAESSPPICPTCVRADSRSARRRRRCPHCGAFIYVRSVPEGGRLLVKEADLPTIQARWAQPHPAPRPEAPWIYAAVVGESHQNPDGRDRQVIIRDHAQVGALARLMPEPENHPSQTTSFAPRKAARLRVRQIADLWPAFRQGFAPHPLEGNVGDSG